MNTLHRPDLVRVMAVTANAAVLAIVLTLALATTMKDLVSAPAPSGADVTRLALGAPAISYGWNASLFVPLLSGPVAVPGASAQR